MIYDSGSIVIKIDSSPMQLQNCLIKRSAWFENDDTKCRDVFVYLKGILKLRVIQNLMMIPMLEQSKW